MQPYATSTRTRRNVDAMRDNGIRLLLSPDSRDDHGMRYMLDNGAWGCFTRGDEWSAEPFERLVADHGEGADMIVVPDIVCGGIESLRRSAEWLPVLDGIAPLLVPVQNGHEPDDVASWLGAACGLFVGGDTEWKEATLSMWGELARARGCALHVGRVNTRRRIRLCAAAGATSFDGKTATMFAVNAPKVARWSAQLDLMELRCESSE